MKFRGRKFVLLFAAWALAIIHPINSVIVLFGWAVEELFYVYGGLVFLTLSSWIVTGECLLSAWEYRIRKALNPGMNDYEYSYLHFHLRNVLDNPPSQKFIRMVGLPFLSISLIIWIINLLLSAGMLQ